MKLQEWLARAERGQTIVEYSMILVLVSVVLIASLTLLEVGIDGYYKDLTAAISSVI